MCWSVEYTTRRQHPFHDWSYMMFRFWKLCTLVSCFLHLSSNAEMVSLCVASSVLSCSELSLSHVFSLSQWGICLPSLYISLSVSLFACCLHLWVLLCSQSMVPLTATTTQESGQNFCLCVVRRFNRKLPILLSGIGRISMHVRTCAMMHLSIQRRQTPSVSYRVLAPTLL